MIRLQIPTIAEDEIKAASDVLRSGFLVQGERVAQFESSVAEYLGVRHAIAVSSGTAALHLSLKAIGVKCDDIVLVSAFSWPATANVIEECGATPHFVDVDPNTFAMSSELLREQLELLQLKGELDRCKSILVVHPFGQMADMLKILEVANAFGVPVIEDAACALGASIQGRSAGTVGKLGCFSFHPRKSITTGEGGMVTTSDDDLADLVRSYRNHGITGIEDGLSEFGNVGLNYRLTEFQAAIGEVQLSKFPEVLEARQRLAEVYLRTLEGTRFQPQNLVDDSTPTWQSFVVRVESSVVNTHVSSLLRERGVESTIGTFHLPMCKYYRDKYGYGDGDFANTDMLFRKALTLPLHVFMKEADQEQVVAALKGLPI